MRMYYHRHISKCECITIDTVFVFGGGGGSVGPGEGWRAKSKCLGRRREEWHGVRRSVEVSMVSRVRNGIVRERESQ